MQKKMFCIVVSLKGGDANTFLNWSSTPNKRNGIAIPIAMKIIRWSTIETLYSFYDEAIFSYILVMLLVAEKKYMM